MGKSIKIEESIYDWLFDHKDKTHKTISNVIKGLIDDSVALQLIGEYEKRKKKKGSD